MRYVGHLFLVLGILGIVLDHVTLACVGTILGSVLSQEHLFYIHRNHLNCSYRNDKGE